MPSGLRYRVTVNSKKFDLSPEQYNLLTKKSVKLPKILDGRDGWVLEQRVRGLTNSGLFHKRNGSFVRTKLGSDVLKALKSKSVNNL